MEEKNQRNSKRRLNSLILLVAFTAIMLIVSTYAWFSSQKNVSLGNLVGTVKVAEGLQISLNAKDWSNSINFADYTNDELKQQYGDSIHNLIPTELLPVSTTANENLAAETGNKELSFYRGTNVNGNNLYTVKTVENDLTKIDDTDKTTTAAGNPDIYPGYYAIDFFLENSSAEGVTLNTLQLNSDATVTIPSEGGNSTVGLENTPRVAFALFNSDTSGSGNVTVGATDQDKILTATTGAKSTIKDVAIWEPNSDSHVDYIVQNNNTMASKANGLSGYLKFLPTDLTAYSIVDADGYTGTQKIPTYALNSKSLTPGGGEDISDSTGTALGKGYLNLYDWSGTYTDKGMEKQITLQTAKAGSGVKNLISVTSDEDTVKPGGTGATEFQIPGGEVCRIRMYVWLEGQDVDTINYASHGGKVEIDVGLIKDAEVAS